MSELTYWLLTVYVLIRILMVARERSQKVIK